MGKFSLAFCLAAMLLTACAETPTKVDTSRYGTWLWDGSSWTQLAHLSGSEAQTPQGTPPAETLSYWKDFGGLVDADGTRWSGTAWVTNDLAYPSPPTATPIANQYSGTSLRERTALVLDEARDQILFLDPNSETMSALSNGTWKLVVLPAQWPKARYLRGVGYDPAHQDVLILTCCNASGPVPTPETWVWTGQALVQGPGLPSKDAYELVPDGEGHMLAFGVKAGFSWDGQSWSSLAGSSALPGMGAVSAVRDDADGQTVAIGQTNNNAVDVWRWHDDKWQPVMTASSPPGGCVVSNPIYDPELSGIVLTDLSATCEVSALP